MIEPNVERMCCAALHILSTHKTVYWLHSIYALLAVCALIQIIMSKFREDLEVLINQNSKENGSDTPDFILADYLADCLDAFDKAVTSRSEWYNKKRDPIQDLYGDMKADAS